MFYQARPVARGGVRRVRTHPPQAQATPKRGLN